MTVHSVQQAQRPMRPGLVWGRLNLPCDSKRLLKIKSGVRGRSSWDRRQPGQRRNSGCAAHQAVSKPGAVIQLPEKRDGPIIILDAGIKITTQQVGDSQQIQGIRQLPTVPHCSTIFRASLMIFYRPKGFSSFAYQFPIQFRLFARTAGSSVRRASSSAASKQSRALL